VDLYAFCLRRITVGAKKVHPNGNGLDWTELSMMSPLIVTIDFTM
jgi:hypothetical protein